MIKVLFVCHGNICRSPMAQYMMEDLVRKEGCEDQFFIDSAATSREEIGNGVHYGTRTKLREMGIPCGNHRARQLTREDYRKFDYLIGMDRENMYYMPRLTGGDPDGKIFSLLSFAGLSRDIADPWYTGNFDDTYDDLRIGLDAFFGWLTDNGLVRRGRGRH